ncbi:MAG TPA: hypothetical protein ENH82_08385 [bacterium]|nr:hypothetical protein [bacterium]
MIPEFHGKIKDGLFFYNNFKVFCAYTKGLKNGDYYLTLHKVKGSPKTLEQLGYFHAVVVPTAFKQMVEDGNDTVKFIIDGKEKELPLTEDMVVVIFKEVWAKAKNVKVKSKKDMTITEASELITISIEWAARYLHCSIPEPSKL